MNSITNRYAIDVRVGCVAVIDTFSPASSPGLHPDSANVMKYWSGVVIAGKLFGCPHAHWHMPGFRIKQAKRYRDLLNKQVKEAL